MRKIPQIISITKISSKGMITLTKETRKYLGSEGAKTLYLTIENEVWLSTCEQDGQELPLIRGKNLRLSEKAFEKLDLSTDSLVGLVMRQDAVAIKKFEIVLKEGNVATIYDLESPLKLAS